MAATENITIRVNGRPVTVPAGTVVAAALESAGQMHLRRSPGFEARGPLCGMGMCFECRVTIDGVRHRRSCQTLCEEGMEVVTDD
jgi:predicted molibdopterin-dependent oxidoreductase YjgC